MQTSQLGKNEGANYYGVWTDSTLLVKYSIYASLPKGNFVGKCSWSEVDHAYPVCSAGLANADPCAINRAWTASASATVPQARSLIEFQSFFNSELRCWQYKLLHCVCDPSQRNGGLPCGVSRAWTFSVSNSYQCVVSFVGISNFYHFFLFTSLSHLAKCCSLA